MIATLALLAGVISIVWALQAAELHHRDEAILDPLTGLLNRHALAPRFLEISHQARLTGQPVCMVLCDVDGFKQINDEHGHDRGDAVLRDIAYELRKRLRSFELVYRLGGEEFLTVLPGIGLRAAARKWPSGCARPSSRRARRTSRSRSPSASAPRAARRSTTTRCSRRPTRRCMRPSARAATAWSARRSRQESMSRCRPRQPSLALAPQLVG